MRLMCEALGSILSPANMHKKEYATISITIPNPLEILFLPPLTVFI